MFFSEFMQFFAIVLCASMAQLCVSSVIIMVPFFKRNIKKKNMKLFLFLMLILTIMKSFITYTCNLQGVPLLNVIFTIIMIVMIYFIKYEMNINNSKNTKLMDTLYTYVLTRFLQLALALLMYYYVNVDLGLLGFDVTLYSAIFTPGKYMVYDTMPRYILPSYNPAVATASSSNLPGTDPRRITTVDQLVDTQLEFSSSRDVQDHFDPKLNFISDCSKQSDSLAKSILYAIDRHGAFFSRLNGHILLHIPSDSGIRPYKREEVEAALPVYLATVDRKKALISDLQKDMSRSIFDTTTNRWNAENAANRIVGKLCIAQRSPFADRLERLIQ